MPAQVLMECGAILDAGKALLVKIVPMLTRMCR